MSASATGLPALLRAAEPQAHRERVVKEHAELIERLGKLNIFIASPEFDTKVDMTERMLLVMQSGAMQQYANALELRMRLWEAQ